MNTNQNLINIWSEYKLYVNKRVTPEENPYYTMLRAGVEMSEEFFEYSSEPSIDELGDLNFWFAYFSYLTGYQLMDQQKEIDEKYSIPILSVMATFIGHIKRYYRDKDEHRLVKIKETLPLIQYYVETELAYNFAITMVDLIDYNVNKLDIRNGK